MTTQVSKVTGYVTIGLPGALNVSKINAYAVLTTTPPSSIGGGGAVDPTIRVWSCSLDGHDFYIMRLGINETLVYDVTTNMWSEWNSHGNAYFRAHIGQNWVGASATTMLHNYGTDIVAGDDRSGILWMLDPVTGVDDTDTTGTVDFVRKVVGGIPVKARGTIPCNAIEMTMNLGAPALVGAAITLKTSDDAGNTWVNQGTITTTASDYQQVVEWRSLGQIGQPGRLFEFSDNGAAVRISGADIR